jgi:hypothetical protein
MLTDKQIKKFQKIYQKKFGKIISKKEAYEQGIRLLNLMKIIIKETESNNIIK